jgi:hypothetical protein
MGPSIPGTKFISRSTDINGALCGGIERMIRGSHCWMLLIALREPPSLLGGIVRMDTDHSFGNGVSSIINR